jgi:hypothetical protein
MTIGVRILPLHFVQGQNDSMRVTIHLAAYAPVGGKGVWILAYARMTNFSQSSSDVIPVRLRQRIHWGGWIQNPLYHPLRQAQGRLYERGRK